MRHELDWLILLADRVENKGYIIQADQVWFVHSGTVVFINSDFFMVQQRLEGQGNAIPLRHTTLGRIHLDERSARWRKFYEL
jgi:hypothetical protein